MFTIQIRKPISFVLQNSIKQKSIFRCESLSSLSILAATDSDRKCSSTNLQQKRYQSLHEQTETKSEEIILKSPFGSIDIPELSLPDFIFQNYNKWADKTALTCGITGRNYNYNTLKLLEQRFAGALLEKCGMQPGETIAILLPNIPEYAVCIYGALRAGLIVTFVNPLYTPDEIRRQFENADTKAIITIDLLLDVAKTVGPLLKGYKVTINVGGKDDLNNKIYGLQNLLAKDYDVRLPQISSNNLAVLPYSSGTTGLPKGVQLTHSNLIANLQQDSHEKLVAHAPTTDTNQDITMTVLPFFHIFGFNGILNLSLVHGLHLVTIPKFTPEDYIKTLVKYKPKILFVVPSLLLFLATHPAVTKEHLTSVKSVISGAASASQSIIEKFRQKVGRDDIDMRQGYGMTEASPVVLMVPVKSPISKYGSAGQICPSTEVKVIDIINGETLGPHKSGELLVRGPQVMSGYWKNEKATQETIDSNGWLRTGDVLYYDEDGYFYVVDRTKELIKVKGNQVSPTELESILLEVPGIADAAVVGVPDELCGEVPRAFVVLRKGVDPPVTDKDIIDYVHPRVAHYKRLKGGIRFVDAIPRNASGKILRTELKVFGDK